jgi:hypothetical protein
MNLIRICCFLLKGFLALIEAVSHAFLRGYSEEQEKAPNKKN